MSEHDQLPEAVRNVVEQTTKVLSYAFKEGANEQLERCIAKAYEVAKAKRRAADSHTEPEASEALESEAMGADEVALELETMREEQGK